MKRLKSGMAPRDNEQKIPMMQQVMVSTQAPFLASYFQFLIKHGSTDFVHRNGRSQCSQHQQSVKQYRNNIPHNRHRSKCLLENVRQSNEDERRTTIRINTYGECCRENHQSRHNGDYRIYGHYLSSRLQQIGLSVEIRGIGTKTSRTQTQGEESLSQSFQHHVLIHF